MSSPPHMDAIDLRLLNLLQQATAVADRTEVLGPIDDNPASTHRPPAADPAFGRLFALGARGGFVASW